MIIEDKIKLTLDRIYDAALKAARPYDCVTKNLTVTDDFLNISEKKYKLNNLRLGDFVYIENYDSSYQHGFLRKAWSLGIVGQTNGPRAGYGPGLTILMSSKTNDGIPKLTTNANIVNYLKFKK